MGVYGPYNDSSTLNPLMCANFTETQAIGNKCYSFNIDPTSNVKVPGIGWKNGLEIVLDYGPSGSKSRLFDLEDLSTVNVFVHKPGVLPDTSVELDLSLNVEIGASVDVVLNAKQVSVTPVRATIL
jgi:hypothetical protein